MSQPIITRTGPGPTPPKPPELDNLEQTPEDVVGVVVEDVSAIPPLRITAADPLRTLALPAESGGALNRDLATTGATKILDRDPRRKRAVIVLFDTGGTSDGAFIGGTQAEANSDLGFLLPLFGPNIAGGNVASIAFEVTSMEELWARAFTAACKCSVWIERWTN